MFISDGGSRFINLNHVREVAITNQGKTIFRFTDGDTITLDGDYSYRIPTSEHHVVPAAPGFECLTLWIGDDERPEQVDSDPIIAWEVDTISGMPNPITADGGCTYSDNATSAVLCPNGAVVEPDLGRWADKETWLVGARKRLAEAQAAKAAANGAGPSHERITL